MPVEYLPDFKECAKCKIVKAQSEFYLHRDRKDGLYYCCKSCSTVDTTKLRTKYGLTVEKYDKILKSQNNGCAICGNHEPVGNRRLSVDHSHKTGKMRGLLCTLCNTSLGSFKDDINILNSAIKYLKKYEEQDHS